MNNDRQHKPEILAPAGDVSSYLAALAAGADAIYVGLKHFSARMQAKNFSITELSALASLGRQHGTRTYVAMNTLVKPSDPESAGRLIQRLEKSVRPEALIVQDIAMLSLARQAGFTGELHLSTLANATHPAALASAARLGAKRIVLPREMNLDEIQAMAKSCPKNIQLEIFIHGALCHCISGRCYWSSFLGGKSGLRGRCVQPCRRLYRQAKSDPQRLFSCMDLSLDVLTKPLLTIKNVNSWKIEGRKKGPHYVFYVVKAYRMLRDNPKDPQAKKVAQDLLEQALGRPTSHSLFLPQRPFIPVNPEDETSSGRMIGQVKREGAKFYFVSREELLPGDLVRVGYEDQMGHRTLSIRRRVPKRGRFEIPRPKDSKKPAPRNGAKVFLVDRREKELTKILRTFEQELEQHKVAKPEESKFVPTMPKGMSQKNKTRVVHMHVNRSLPKGRLEGHSALWLERSALQGVSRQTIPRTTWWLPPVIWPEEETKYRRLLRDAQRNGAKTFVLNSPWQAELFQDRKAELIAGPYCNAANHLTLETLKKMGFSSAIISPELAAEDIIPLAKRSPLPLGMVIKGLWPFGLSRILAPGVKEETPIKSPMNEVAWVRKYGQNYWIFPGWEMDMSAEIRHLERAGIRTFVHMHEPWPKAVPRPKRTSTFNWNNKLL